MSYYSIHEALKTILEGISEIQVVYGSPQTNVSGYPACIVEPISHESSIFTNTDNLRTYTFSIVLIMEYTHKPLNQALLDMEQLMDIVIDELEGDYNLDGVLINGWGSVTEGTVVYDTDAQGKHIFAQLQWQGRIEKKVTS